MVKHGERQWRLVSILCLAACLALAGWAGSAWATASGQAQEAQMSERTPVAFTSYGSGDEALVFIHGWSCNQDFWRNQVPFFEGKVRVITLDLPGHGKSGKPHTEYTLELFAKAVEGVLNEAKVKKAVLVGHSMGAPVARALARRRPDLVAGLVLDDGAFMRIPTDTAAKKAHDKQVQGFMAALSGSGYKQFVEGFVDQMCVPQTPEDLRAYIKSQMSLTPQYVMVSAMKNFQRPENWTGQPLDVPTLAIYAQSPYITPDFADFIKRLFPDSKLIMWDGVGHFLMMERPEQFNQALMDFIKSRKLLPVK